MTTQVIVTAPTGSIALRPLLEAAMSIQLRVIKTGLRRTERRLQNFENQYNMSSKEFYQRLTQDQIEETLDTIEWAGEYHTLLRLRQQHETLKEARIAD
ncbi:MAG: hypothetical protein DRI77_05725 [Chloroflexi bacterium]|nr:MAG: hypothetical protein DRI77_05725 [Chloroflexota bacterium]